MSSPRPPRLPYLMTVSARFLAQGIGFLPAVRCDADRTWWTEWKEVPRHDPDESRVMAALENFSWFLYANTSSGWIDTSVWPSDEPTIPFDAGGWKTWVANVGEYVSDEAAKVLESMRDDLFFKTLVCHVRGSFMLDVVLTSRNTCSFPMMNPDMRSIASRLGRLSTHGISEQEYKIAEEAWKNR